MRWAPVLFLPAPLRALPSQLGSLSHDETYSSSFPLADLRVTPHYPAKSPLDDLVRLVVPGSDEFITEKYAFEISQLLDGWGRRLKSATPALEFLATFLDASLEASSLAATSEDKLRPSGDIEVFRTKFGTNLVSGRERFLREMRTYLASISRVETAEFQVVQIQPVANSPVTVEAEIRYDLVSARGDGGREQRVGYWRTRWICGESNAWRVARWQAVGETLSRAREPIFADVTSQAFGKAESYKKQLVYGVDYWRTVLDGACGIDIFGNNGLAVGDIDNDGFDDLYVCQPAGLPNRLYRNRGDGTFEDVAAGSGVDVLDSTACALFADFENKGRQDLLVVCSSGPLLFLNQGNGKFSLKRDAFRFKQPPQGSFTHGAVADYDGDGRLDIYLCLYAYYQGLEQYRYPVPYFDARNGPPNFLLHNEGGATFEDRTEAAGLHVDNDRYSFACAWGDYRSDGHPDLYVANDFGRNNLYRNNGDGTFSSVAGAAGVDEVGAGMSACWFDFNNDGQQDIYVSNMWSAAGLRVSQQSLFQRNDPQNIRELYQQHAKGNSLYRNLGNGKFENVSGKAGVDMGRWAWCSDAWDFDHDGYPDLYVANGYISGPSTSRGGEVDAASFFWRQVVGKSPQSAGPSSNYEQGWNAINELIRSDKSWSGHERNVFYANNRDGTFSDISGAAGLDFPDDSRSFVLADIDRDGRLECILKNRSGPQLRVLRNMMQDLGHCIVFRLRGTKSNRDAIGAAVTVEIPGLRQTKYLQAGSGFLSQHTKEMFFGLGGATSARSSIRWPSGLTQTFEQLPVNHRIEIKEGEGQIQVTPFAISSAATAKTGGPQAEEILPSSVETWLLDPMAAPDFSLPDLSGKIQNLRSFQGRYVLLLFWSMTSPSCGEQLRLVQREHSALLAGGLEILGVNADDSPEPGAIQAFATKQRVTFPILVGSREMLGVYNIIYRYLYDRRRDLAVPTSFLVDPNGTLVKVYQGEVTPERLLEDIKGVPTTPADREIKALPLRGTLYQGTFRRNSFTYGVALFQRGYLGPAEASFKQVIAENPNDPEAYYNLGTLYLRSNSLEKARGWLEKTVELQPDYPEAWNNLGMISAQQGQDAQAIREFQQALSLKPGYATALLNLGNVYRRQGSLEKAEKFLKRALEIEPDNADVQYSVGILFAKNGELDQAAQHLGRAIELRPDYPDALNNLGVLLVRKQDFAEAKEKFESCIRAAPKFDQAYLNLARLYVILNEKEKAKAILLALLQQEPEHKMAREALEMLN